MDLHLVQMAIARGKPALNRAKVQALTAPLLPPPGAAPRPKASSREPALVVLPELFSTGYLDASSAAAPGPKGPGGETWEEVGRKDREFLAGLSRSLNCWVAGTTVDVEESSSTGPAALGSPRFRNVSLLFDPDGAAEPGIYRKVHPFSYGGEDKLFAGGGEVVTLDIGSWVVQPTICYDLRFPELYRAGSQRGVHLILVQANWPEARQSHWDTLLKARAIENQAFVVGVNCTGSQEGLRFAGGSALLSPKGEVLAQGGDAESLINGQAELDHVRQWRKAFPALRDRRPPDFYRALASRDPNEGP